MLIMPRYLSPDEIRKIIRLRQKGNSLNEIRAATGKGSATIFKYIQGVAVDPEYQLLLRQKQGRSKYRAQIEWDTAKKIAKEHIALPFSRRDKLLLLTALYWGEGTKKELNIINSDAGLLRVVIQCLRELGVPDTEIKLSLRIFSDCDRQEAIKYWSSMLGLDKSQIGSINLLEGKKGGKLPYGMCRIRVRKGARYFKVIMSMIDLVRTNV